LIAVKREALRAIWEVNKTSVMKEKPLQDDRQMLYELLYELIRNHGGFSGRRENGMAPVYHIRQVLFHSRESGYEQIRELRLPETIQCVQPKKGEAFISVIIPSKDNPEVLFYCIYSLLERTHTVYPYEIIIVDNGSNDSNRQRIEEEIECLKSMNPTEDGFTYVYQPMEFNFSDMCNIGAGKAKGNILLFLNDDMEILQADWLDLMVEKAALPYAGAVGVKLLYPNSDTIQHAGITNLRVGPAHKLQFLSDEKVHYYGMNRGVHNMLAVTGACLMLRWEVFDQAGGFCRELAVAFNDVDLCYTLYEKGYYNIVRNDVILYHHESLSRGKDGESEEKQLRLLREKDLLYERHQALYGKDPFYHPYLTTDMLEADYSPACRYQVTLDMPWSEVTRVDGIPAGAREDSCLVVGMECAMDIYKWKYGVEAPKEKKANSEDMGYYFQGYSFVIGSDNACFTKKLLLRDKEKDVIFEILVDERCRKDIKNNLSDQLNVDLTGFAAKVKMNVLPEGNYQFGMLAKDRCSRLELVNWSSWTLEVKK
ncbi:MAG: glycosyltransferase, partial [Lachnospiraceae bacterium]|nr:glycosyltransferase [Lachnospiraceae bacterium]